MKVQTVVLLVCFLAGVLLSVGNAKPSPELMRELISLEKFLEKKQGDEGTNNELVPDEKPEDTSGNQNPENTPDSDTNENSNNGGGEPNTEGSSGGAGTDEGSQNPKPEDQNNGEEQHLNEESSGSGGGGEEERPEEGNKPEEVETTNGRDDILEELDDITRKIQDALEKLRSLGDDFRKGSNTGDEGLKNLKDEIEQYKAKTKVQLGKVNSAVDEAIGALLEDTGSESKRSKVPQARGNAPARRNLISRTEFLRTLYNRITKT